MHGSQPFHRVYKPFLLHGVRGPFLAKGSVPTWFPTPSTEKTQICCPFSPQRSPCLLSYSHKADRGGGSGGWGLGGLLIQLVNKYLLNIHSRDIIEHRGRQLA